MVGGCEAQRAGSMAGARPPPLHVLSGVGDQVPWSPPLAAWAPCCLGPPCPASSSSHVAAAAARLLPLPRLCAGGAPLPALPPLQRKQDFGLSWQFLLDMNSSRVRGVSWGIGWKACVACGPCASRLCMHGRGGARGPPHCSAMAARRRLPPRGPHRCRCCCCCCRRLRQPCHPPYILCRHTLTAAARGRHRSCRTLTAACWPSEHGLGGRYVRNACRTFCTCLPACGAGSAVPSVARCAARPSVLRGVRRVTCCALAGYMAACCCGGGLPGCWAPLKKAPPRCPSTSCVV